MSPEREEDKNVADQQISDYNTDAVMQPFVEFWSSYIEQTNEGTRKMLESINGSTDPQVWKRRWLDALSQSLDTYMRSPAFLEAMRHNMDALTKAKGQVEDVRQEVARQMGVPTTEDISGLFERIHSVEESIIQRLERIEKRLEGLGGGDSEA